MKFIVFCSSFLLFLGTISSSKLEENISAAATPTNGLVTTIFPTTPITPPTTTPTTPPTTTPTTPVQTTSTPTPPEIPRYNVTGSDGNICILLAVDAKLVVYYNASKNNETLNATIPIGDADSSGSCDDEYINLRFRHPADGALFRLNITFTKDSNLYQVSSLRLTFNYDEKTFPDTELPGKFVEAELVEIPSYLKRVGTRNSIKCADNKELALTGNMADVTFLIKDIQLQAYMNTTSGTFGEAKDCRDSNSSEIVPIAVGCALAALVIVVLIAYLIGRRRSRQQGYQSV